MTTRTCPACQGYVNAEGETLHRRQLAEIDPYPEPGPRARLGYQIIVAVLVGGLFFTSAALLSKAGITIEQPDPAPAKLMGRLTDG